MRSELEKMLSGELYDPGAPELVRKRERARQLCRDYNLSAESARQKRHKILRDLVGKMGDQVAIQPPFHCDYGFNLSLGDNVFFNFNCVILDVCPVRIGSFTLFGPGVQVYAATHPMDARLRRQQELGKPVEIGCDVWVGGGAIILPGVTIGCGSVIGAGSVVTRSIPASVVAVGNPCRVIRSVNSGEPRP